MMRIYNYEDYKKMLSESDNKDVVLFKHSTRCPVSAAALNQVSKLTDVDVYVVYVVEDRELSSKIADELLVKHESPQAIILSNKEVKGHLNHFDVTEDNILHLIKTRS